MKCLNFSPQPGISSWTALEGRLLLLLLLSLLMVLSPSCTKKVMEIPENKKATLLEGQELLDAFSRVADSGNKNNESGFEELEAFSAHTDYLIRVQAIKQLTKTNYMNFPKTQEILLRTLHDEHWLVRSFSVRALSRVSGTEIRSALSKRLEIEENERVRKYLGEALR